MVARTTAAAFGHAQFSEHAEGGLGMKEGNLFVASAVEGFVVDEFDASLRCLRELGNNVIGAKGNVMDAAIGVFLQELGDRAFRIGGFEQFDVNIANVKEGGSHFLGRNFLAVLALESESFFVICDGRIE